MSTKALPALSYTGLVIAILGAAVAVYLLVTYLKQKSEPPPGTGPTGPEGPPGQRGITGPTGPAGAPGNVGKAVQLISASYAVGQGISPGRLLEQDFNGSQYFEVDAEGGLTCLIKG